MTVNVCRRGTEPGDEDAYGRSTLCGEKTRNSLSDLLHKNLPFTEEAALSGIPKFQKREILMALGRGCRWGKLRREVIRGTVWFFPVPEASL